MSIAGSERGCRGVGMEAAFTVHKSPFTDLWRVVGPDGTVIRESGYEPRARAWASDFNLALTTVGYESIKSRADRADELLAMLRELEWAGEFDGSNLHCPCCGMANEHAPDCRLAKLLEESK